MFGIKIEITPERMVQLEAKLAEYQKRLNNEPPPDDYKHPDMVVTWYQTFCSVKALTVVCKHVEPAADQIPETNNQAVQKRINQVVPETAQWEIWRNACAVALDYATTGGANVIGGTGLPPVDDD